MSNPNPGYGYVECAVSDPKRTHYRWAHSNQWLVADNTKDGNPDLRLVWRKPVEIPDGWELVPESDLNRIPAHREFEFLTPDGKWQPLLNEIFRCTAAEWRSRICHAQNTPAFIRRKPAQPTVEPSKPAVDWSKPISTKRGASAVLLGTLKDGTRVVAIDIDGTDKQLVRTYNDSGSYWGKAESENDIINAPERIKRDVWLNVYPSGECFGYKTKELADRWAERQREACIKVPIDCEKGAGL